MFKSIKTLSGYCMGEFAGLLRRLLAGRALLPRSNSVWASACKKSQKSHLEVCVVLSDVSQCSVAR